MLHKVLTVKYITLKTCYCYLSEQNFKLLDQGITVKLSYYKNEAYFSAQSLSGLGENEVGINGLQAQALGLSENEFVTVTCEHVSGIRTITISPASADDYEVLELLAENVELTLLNQIRVVNRNQKVVIWISNSLHITVNVDDAQPVSPGRLDNLTEVAIAKPKIGKSEKYLESLDTDLTSSIRSVVKYFTKDLRPPSPANNDLLTKYGDRFSALPFALHPVTDLNCYPRKSGFAECMQHFNVFVHKHHLPIRFSQLNTLNETIVVILVLIPPPSDEQNERHSRKFAVRLCAIEDFFETRKAQVAQYPTKLLYAHDCIVKFYNVKPGVKVLLKKLEPASAPEIKTIRILTTGSNIKVAEECFKLFVNKGCESGKIVLNPKILLEFSQEFSCTLHLVPENANFCLVDPDFVRNCRFKAEEFEINLEEKRCEKTKVPTEDRLCTEVGNFDEILKRSLMVFEHALITRKTTIENVLITGKVGAGKSSLIKIIQEKLNSPTYRIHTESVSCERLKGKTPDSLYSKLSTLFSNCMYYQPSVLILDNLQAICEKVVDDETHAQDAEHYNRISEELADMIQRYSKRNLIAVLATAESTAKLNVRIFGTRGKRQLFKNVFDIADLDKTDRSKMLQVLFGKKCGLEGVDLDEVAVKTEGFVAQDFVDFTNRTVFESFKEENDQFLPVVKPHHCDAVFPKMSALFLKDIKLHSPGERNFADIGGLDDVKAVFIEHLLWPIKYPNIFGKAPIRLQSGLLLYGPPGTGKTILAGAAAKQCGFRLIAVKGPELLSKYIGASEEAVRNIFQKAQAAKPCMLFFDEFDSLAPRRGHDSTGVTDRVVNQFLTQLDGVETLTGVCVLAATSRPDLLDPALLRPGRLDKQILCPLPDEKARLDILKVLSKDTNLSSEASLGEVAAKTEGYSGADLQAILYTAQMNALVDGDEEEKDFSAIQITQTHLENAVSTTRPSLSKTERLKFDAIYEAFRQGGDLTTYLKQNQQKATLA